jgi:hypothetical protein
MQPPPSPHHLLVMTTLTLVKAIFSRSGDWVGSVSRGSCVRLLTFEFMIQISLMYTTQGLFAF